VRPNGRCAVASLLTLRFRLFQTHAALWRRLNSTAEPTQQEGGNMSRSLIACLVMLLNFAASPGWAQKR